MSEELKAEEKKQKADAHDSLIKHVFDNLRNLFISATLALAGGAVLKYRAELPLGSLINLAIGICVVVSAALLLGWNMLHGIEKLIRPLKGTKKGWLALPFATLYMVAAISIFQAWITVQTEQKQCAEGSNSSLPNLGGPDVSP